MIHFFWNLEDHYLQTVAFNISKAIEQTILEFLGYVGKHFKGYDMFLGFPAENNEAVNYLTENGFQCIENDYNNIAFLDEFETIKKNDDLLQINKENYVKFESLHKKIEYDMYWNSERIFADLDDWIILVKEKKGMSQGAVYYTVLDDG